jgi:uncharacterized membrane protein (DUF485 family)
MTTTRPDTGTKSGFVARARQWRTLVYLTMILLVWFGQGWLTSIGYPRLAWGVTGAVVALGVAFIALDVRDVLVDERP